MARADTDRNTLHIRTEIAHRAAKLVVEESIHDFAQAKRKAAKQLGISDRHALPSNEEINAALADYRQLYDPDHAQILRSLRQKAVFLLDFFAPFQPYLTGSVLNGRAGEHSNINLLPYHDDPKSVELFLVNQHVEYEIINTQGAARYENYPTLSFWFDNTPVRIQLQPRSAERNPQHKSDRERIALPALKFLLASEAEPPRHITEDSPILP